MQQKEKPGKDKNTDINDIADKLDDLKDIFGEDNEDLSGSKTTESEKTGELELLVDILSRDLAESYLMTVKVLSSIVTLLERYYIGSHSRFVSQNSARIAYELGMNDTEIFEIKTAGLLHDIGKTGFKETLLYKNSMEMSQAERHTYRKHPELGKEILSHHLDFKTVGEIVYQHHERLDGSGFPQHLKSNSIHPGAAIIQVVDTYHNAMFKITRDKLQTATSSIKYSSSAAYLDSTRKKYASAMNFLNLKKGILFSTKIVDIFTEMMEEERRLLGQRSVQRMPVTDIDDGMIFAEDYYTNYGLLIAARGESITKDMVKILVRFAEAEQIPKKILVMK